MSAPDLIELGRAAPVHFMGIDGAGMCALAEIGAPAWVRVVSYIDDMPRALAAADLAVSRAGAIATSEFLAWGLPSVLVPLPTAAADHQGHNAVALAAAGAAVHLPERELSGERLWSTIEGLAVDPVRLEALRKAARERGRPESARRIAASLVDLLPPAATSTGDAR